MRGLRWDWLPPQSCGSPVMQPVRKRTRKHRGPMLTGATCFSRAYLRDLAVLGSRLLHRRHDLVEVERGRLLTRRKLLEALDPLRDIALCRDQQEDAPEQPVVVVDRVVISSLERIAAQVEY